MIRFPRQLKVGGLRIEINRDLAFLEDIDCSELPTLAPCEMDPRHITNRKAIGCYSYREQRITVSPKLPLSAARETLLHEVGHLAWYLCGFSDDKILSKQEEKVIGGFMLMLLDIIRQNPQLLKYLTDKTT